jgi:hypothetical protein
MNRNTLSLSDRVQKAAEILKTDSEKIKQALECLGIDVGDEFSEKLIDAETTTEDMIRSRLLDFLGHGLDPKTAPKAARVAAAVAILKGKNPFETATEVPAVSPVAPQAPDIVTAIAKVLESSKPVQQLKDKELLERYVAERDYEMEQELNRRAKNQPFVILKKNGKHEAGKEPIDVEASYDLLRAARKGRTNPTIVPYEGAVANVYRITELNINDRRVELCPICGETLYKGYCERCESNFEGIAKDERAYVHLVAISGKFNRDSFADRKALLVSAAKGLDDLRTTCPGVSKKFDELKETEDLPRLVIIENRPSRVSDPFHVAGNRTF